MAGAVCSKCGKYYRWSAKRGHRLTDFPSPCCKAPGRGMNKALNDRLVYDETSHCYRVPGIGEERR